MAQDPFVPSIVPVPAPEDGAAVAALGDAFAEYPALRHMIGPPSAAYGPRLEALLAFFVAARRARGEPVIGVRAGAGWAAVAIATLPDAATPPGALDAVREPTWTVLGDAARARYEDLGQRWSQLAVEEPHVHLNLVGVRPVHRGRGFGLALVRAVAALAGAHPTAQGVSLTTETEANVGFYGALGFGVRGTVDLAPDLRSWMMYRPNRTGTRASGGSEPGMG